MTLTRYAISGVVSNKEEAYLVNENAKRIWFRDRSLISFDFEPLQSLQMIEQIFLDDNHLEMVNLDPLSNIKSLQVLSLAGNRIKSIDLSPLRNCRDLRWLSLSDNQLETIDLAPLERCEKLEYLFLSGNNLSSIDLLPLARVTQLKEIIISKNIDDSIGTIIDLTPLVSLRKLRKIGLHELERVTLGLQAHQFGRVPRAVTSCLAICKEVSVEQMVLKRLETLGPKRALESLEQDLELIDPQYWFSVRKDILKPLGLDIIAGFDGKISELAPLRTIKNWEEGVLIKASEAITKGARSTLLDLDVLNMKNGIHAKLHSAILENRLNELQNVRVFVCEGCVDFREVWYTAWGFKFLTEYGMWIFGQSGKLLIDLRDDLRKLGFDLEFVSVKIRDVWPSANNEPSPFLRRTILGSADRTASPQMKKKAINCIMKSNLHPLRGEYERIVTELYDRGGEGYE